MTPAGRWADLRLRIASGLVLAVVGAVTTWVGGSLFLLLVLVLYAVMTWELAGMTALDAGPVRIALAALAALSIWAAMTQLDRPFGLIALMLPPLGLFVTMRADRLLIAAYDAAMMASAAGVILLRQGGALVFLWIVLVVVVTEQAHDEATRKPGRLAALGQPIAGRRDDRGQVKARSSVGGRTETHLQVVAAVGRGILDGFTCHAA